MTYTVYEKINVFETIYEYYFLSDLLSAEAFETCGIDDHSSELEKISTLPSEDVEQFMHVYSKFAGATSDYGPKLIVIDTVDDLKKYIDENTCN